MFQAMRLLQAMQTRDKNVVATPEGWTSGCDVIAPPPRLTGRRLADRLLSFSWSAFSAQHAHM